MTAREFPAPEIENRPLMFCSRESCKREITKRDPVWTPLSGGVYCSQECVDATPGYVGPEIAPRSRMPANPFADLAPHQSSSPTSTAAAVKESKTMRSKMFLVYEYIKARGAYGATRQEIADDLGIPIQTVCGRVRRLYQMGHIGSNCVLKCKVARCGHDPECRLSLQSGYAQEIMLHEDHVLRWQEDQTRPAQRLSWDK